MKNRIKNKSGGKYALILALLIVIATAISFFYPLRSYLVMSLYSRYNYGNSVMKAQDFNIIIKGGLSTNKRDWYPFVNIYDTSYEFSKYADKDLSLTVLYNFGAFNGKSSSFYDGNSDYFSAFYGAYVLRDNEKPETQYGFKDGEANMDEIAAVPMFDYKYLVIEDLGCPDPVFDILDYETTKDIEYIGYKGWTMVESHMYANSPSHTKRERKLGYIQYGFPMNNGKEDFYETDLYGRMYARYFDEYGCTIVIYVMGADEDMIDECDSDILSKTFIGGKE